MRGIDVSKNNASINYSTLYRLGYEFAIIRDGFGWGSPGKRDTSLDAHYNGATEVGMKVGYYHYVYSTNAYGAAQEAKAALEYIKGKRTDLFIACDIEEKAQAALSNSALTDMVIMFTDEIRKAGFRPAVYSFVSLLSRLEWDRIPEDVLVWAAHWGVKKPSLNRRVDCWQHDVIGNGSGCSVKGILPGAGGDIDVNILYDVTASSQPESTWEERYHNLAEGIIELAEKCIVGG